MPTDEMARLKKSIATVEKAIKVKREPALTRTLAKLDQELAAESHTVKLLFKWFNSFK